MEIERILGRIEEQSKSFDHRLGRIENKVDHLLEFKWKLTGIAVLGAFLATVIVEIMRA
jgi:hypothetical protein